MRAEFSVYLNSGVRHSWRSFCVNTVQKFSHRRQSSRFQFKYLSKFWRSYGQDRNYRHDIVDLEPWGYGIVVYDSVSPVGLARFGDAYTVYNIGIANTEMRQRLWRLGEQNLDLGKFISHTKTQTRIRKREYKFDLSSKDLI